MSSDRIDVGDLQLVALSDADGDIDEPIDGAFPGWPDGQLLAYRDIDPAVYGANGTWHLKVRAWLVHHAGGSILIDTGIGAAGSPATEWFGAPGHLHEALAEAGTPAESIRTVVVSHVHDDHIGGTVLFTGDGGGPQPAFPNARHLVQRADLEWARAGADASEEAAGAWTMLMAPLEAAGLIEAVEGDVDVVDGVALHHLPGHTPGHQVVRLSSGSDRAVICADSLMHPAQIPHPDWATSNDEHHATAVESRIALLAEIAEHPGTVVAPTHFGASFGEIATGPDGLRSWMPR